MRTHIILILMLSLGYINEVKGQMAFRSNGVFPVKKGSSRAEIRVGEIMIYEPLSAILNVSDPCLADLLTELNAQGNEIFPPIKYPTAVNSTGQRFVGAIIAGAAMGVAAGALAMSTAAVVVAAENKKNIAENRAAINRLREDSLALKQGLTLVTDALNEVAQVIGAIQGFINNELLPALSGMNCEIKKNTMRSRIIFYWLSIISRYQNLIAEPHQEFRVRSEEIKLKKDPEVQKMVFNKYGIDPSMFNSDRVNIRMSLLQVEDLTMMFMASIYRAEPTGRVVYDLPRIPLLDNKGFAVVSDWPQKVICDQGTGFASCWKPSDTCTDNLGNLDCVITDKDYPVNMTCGGDCQFTRSATDQAYMGNGQNGVFANCDLISCNCDGVPYVGMQNFVDKSCGVLKIGENVVIRLRVIGEVFREPIELESPNLKIPSNIDLSNNITTITNEVNQVIKDVGNWNSLPGLQANGGALMVWMIISIIIIIVHSALILFLWRKLRREGNAGHNMTTSQSGLVMDVKP